MMLSLQRYTFNVEYCTGSSLLIADTLSRAPLPTSSHQKLRDELVFLVELETTKPDLSRFRDATLQDIRTAASSDPELMLLSSLIQSGWPHNKSRVPPLAQPYWTFRNELVSHEGLLFKQDRVIIPSTLRQEILQRLHVAHRGLEFTLRHARNCVFWPGINSQVSDLCRSCPTCAQYTSQNQQEPLRPYPIPTLPWQLVSQDLFELNGLPYLVTVDYFSDFYELDRLLDIQSSSVIQATKQHFARHGVPHTLITDNGAQLTSDLFKKFSEKYKFNHITSSPYWSQSNGRAEAAVKSAKHILLTAEDVDLALLSVRNTPPAGHTFSPAQRLYGRTLRTDLPQPVKILEPRTPSRKTVVADHFHRKVLQKKAYDKRAGPPLPELPPGSYVYAKPPPVSTSKAWIPGKIVSSTGPRSYIINTATRPIRRNRVQIKPAPPKVSSITPNHKQVTSLPDRLQPNHRTFPHTLAYAPSRTVGHLPEDSPQPAWSSASPDSETSIKDGLNSQTPALQQAPTSPPSTVAVPDTHESAGSPTKAFSESSNPAPPEYLEPPASSPLGF